MPTDAERDAAINANTQAINNITSNSENIDDLTLQNPIELTSEFPLTYNNQDFKGSIQGVLNLISSGLKVTIPSLVGISFDFPLNNKTGLDSLHGTLLINNSEDGIILNPSTQIIGDGGLSKVMASVVSGTDIQGSFTITGTSVDRVTGVETISDNEVILVDGLTTNNTTIDSNGNTVHSYTNAYLSNKWWKGTLTFSTTDLDLTEIRFAQLAFEQFNDVDNLTIETLDISYITSNTNAEMDCYMYSVERGLNNVVDIVKISELHHNSGDFVGSYRRRIGNINKELDCTKEGIFIDLFLKPDNLQYFSSFTNKVWGTRLQDINLTSV